MNLSLDKVLPISVKYKGIRFKHYSMKENEYFYVEKGIIHSNCGKTISDYDISQGWEFYSIYKVGQTLRVTKATNVLGYYTAECLTFTPPLTVILTNVDPFVLYGICYYNGELGKVILFTKKKKDKFEIINTHPSFEDAVSSKEWLKSKTSKNPQELEIKDEKTLGNL